MKRVLEISCAKMWMYLTLHLKMVNFKLCTFYHILFFFVFLNKKRNIGLDVRKPEFYSQLSEWSWATVHLYFSFLTEVMKVTWSLRFLLVLIAWGSILQTTMEWNVTPTKQISTLLFLPYFSIAYTLTWYSDALGKIYFPD